MSIAGIRSAIASALTSVTFLKRIYTYPPESIGEPPCAYIVPKSGNFHDDFAGSMTHEFEVVVLLTIGPGFTQQQTALDLLIDETASAIRAAIEGASLGSNADAIVVTGYHDYGGIQYGENPTQTFMGVKFDVQVST
ncbi:MAG: hypothetical protein WC683_13615 [bacterium]